MLKTENREIKEARPVSAADSNLAERQSSRTKTLVDIFSRFENSELECVVNYDGYRTWIRTQGEVARAARALAGRLRAAGVVKGDKVIFWAENSPEWIAALWACLITGIIVVPLDFRSSPEFVARIQGITQARIVLAGRDMPGISQAPCPVWRMEEMEWPQSGIGVPDAISALAAQVQAEDVAEIVFTSGSTGTPKGVILTHRNILASMSGVQPTLERFRPYLRWAGRLRVLNLLPLSHMFGQALAAFIPPMGMASVVFIRSYSPQEIARAIQDYGVIAVVLVPQMLESMREWLPRKYSRSTENPGGKFKRVWRHRRLHFKLGWKFCCFIVGAAPLDADLEQFWARRGYFVIQGYGMTEAAPIVTVNAPGAAQPGTAGLAMPGIEIKIAEDGEVLIRGDAVTSGYFGAAGEMAAFSEGGWFHTGDLGELTPTGHLILHGRKKELIVTPDGVNVVPDDVERVLDSIPGVRASAVVGPDRVRAAIVLEPGASIDSVVRRANEQLEQHQRIREAAIWPGQDLPRTPATQKVRRVEVLEWFERGRTAMERAAPEASAENPLYRLLAKYAPGRTITAQTTLDELGLSSLDRVELMIEAERTLGREVDESAFAGNRTAAELLAVPKAPEPEDFADWARSAPFQWLRRIARPVLLLPLTRVYAKISVSGLENLRDIQPPVIFASNHQSYFDTPVILTALPPRLRDTIAPAAWKEYFAAYFHPQGFSLWRRFVITLQYLLAAAFFNIFPLPQSDPDMRRTLRYAGSLINRGYSILIFPEGRHTDTGEIGRFMPGIGILASRLQLPVVPIRLVGVDRVLHRTARWPTRGPVQVKFGPPMRLVQHVDHAQDYAALADQVERAVRNL